MKWVVLFLLLVSPAFGQATDPSATRSSSPVVAAPSNAVVPNYTPATGADRLKWFAVTTAGPLSLLVSGPVSSAWGTMLNKPKEYGPHWDGFGARYGMRLTGISTENAMEASMGALWGEDPRYFPSPQRGFGPRVKYVIRCTFVAPDRDGRWHPAYARFAGNVGSNFLSNTWREPSENSVGSAVLRVFWGVVGDMAGNAYTEFWPDVKRKILRRR
jgi:hypothetical protein